MSKRLGFRNHAAERKVIDDANAHMESMFGDLREAKGAPPMASLFRRTEPRKARAKPQLLEQDVIRAIKALLAVHPLVVFACRQNSGAASYEAKSGRYAPVKFYEILKSPEHVTIPDFWGILRDGRMFAVEAKRPGWTKPTDQREFKQAEFLAMVRNCGGIGIFATSVEQVAEALI